MRILHVSQPVESGVVNVVLNLTADQERRGWVVVVACPPRRHSAEHSKRPGDRSSLLARYAVSGALLEEVLSTPATLAGWKQNAVGYRERSKPAHLSEKMAGLFRERIAT